MLNYLFLVCIINHSMNTSDSEFRYNLKPMQVQEGFGFIQ